MKKKKYLSLSDVLPNLIDKGLIDTDLTIKERREKNREAQKSTTKPKASGHNTRLKKERVLHKK